MLRRDDPLADHDELVVADLADRTRVAIPAALPPSASQHVIDQLTRKGLQRFRYLPGADSAFSSAGRSRPCPIHEAFLLLGAALIRWRRLARTL